MPPKVVSKPIITPGTGTFYEAQAVTILCSTVGATVCYTLDGSEPQATSNPYAGPITIDGGSVTIKAKGFLKGWTDSVTASEMYTFVVADPAIVPVGGTYLDSLPAVFITCLTPSATVHFTTDGTEPSIFSPPFTVAFLVEISTRVKAKAFKNGYADSQISEELFIIKLAPPSISPGTGTYSGDVDVWIQNPVAHNLVYTVDNSEPSLRALNRFAKRPGSLLGSGGSFLFADLFFGGPLRISETTTVKAKAVKIGCEDSDTSIAVLTIKAEEPSMSPKGGTYENGVGVVINADSHASTYYTIDGSTPTSGSLLYQLAESQSLFGEPPDIHFGGGGGGERQKVVWLDVSTTLKARSFKRGCEDSDVASESYTIKVATPTFGLGSSVFDSFAYITLNCTTQGATIRYTTDGSEPGGNSTAYTGGFIINQTTTIKAKAFKPGAQPSNTAKQSYTQTPSTRAAKPIILPIPQPFYPRGFVIGVTIHCSTLGATIRYTLDHSTPTSSSPVYTTKLRIVTPKSIKAKAFKRGLQDSPTATAAYKSI